MDITDFSILAARWNDPIDETLSTGADVTGDGVQSTADFTAIQLNFMTVGDPADSCAVDASADRDGLTKFMPSPALPVVQRVLPRSTIKVKRLAIANPERVDLNADGVVDAVDIRAFARLHGLRLLPEFERCLRALQAGKVRVARR